MEALKAEQERKRKQLEALQLTGNKKFFKKADLEKRLKENTGTTATTDQQNKEPILAQAEKEKSINENGSTSTSTTTTTATTTAHQPTLTTSVSTTTTPANDLLHRLPKFEIIRRLRERYQPIRLFGETDADVAERLRQLEILEPDVNKGLRNDFMDAIGIVNQEMIDELMQQETTFEEKVKKQTKSVEAEKLSFADLNNMAKALQETDNKANLQLVLKFLKYLLKLWESELDERDEEEKRSMQGKTHSAVFVQTLSYIKPLFRAIKNQEVPEDIAPFLIRITRYMLNREYLKAGDEYLQMAIGNAPWPMGVTMVGIHARNGREKISAQKIAHVLNDETQRKYIQALKRLMTFCQRRFITDPSKCTEYVKQ